MMSNIKLQPLIFDEIQIKTLYLDNEWYAYTNDIETLYQGIKQSTETIGAYIDNTLIGLIRVISDKTTICYIQDILLLKEYQRQGIGSLLMNYILKEYHQCRQIVLMTDDSEESKPFYKKLGFVEYKDIDCVGFYYKK